MGEDYDRITQKLDRAYQILGIDDVTADEYAMSLCELAAFVNPRLESIRMLTRDETLQDVIE